MKDIVVIGGGGHAKSTIAVLKDTDDFSPVGYTDLLDQGEILGVPYLGEDSSLDSDKHNYLAMGVSYLKTPKDLSLRKILIQKFLNKFEFPVVVSSSSVIKQNSNFGKGTVVYEQTFVNVNCFIGDFCVINNGAIVEHDCNIGDYSFISPGSIICGDVKIGKNVFIGAGVTIVDSVKICDNVVIGAGSLVNKNIEFPGVYIGTPAKKIS